MMLDFNKGHWPPILLLSVIYSLLSFLGLVNFGIYWDDWWLISVSNGDMYEMFKEAGNPIWAYLHLLFRASPSPLVSYRIAQFLCGYISMISVYVIVQKAITKDRYWAFWTAALFVALPLNFSKITYICFPYTICAALFYFAFALMLYRREMFCYRLLAYFLFFLSFMTNSVIAFYLVFLLVLYVQAKETNTAMKGLKGLSAFFVDNWFFVVLPVLFVGFKYFVLPIPSGAYAGYNSLQFSPGFMFEAIQAFFVVLRNIFPKSFLLIAGSGVLLYLLFRKISGADFTPKLSFDRKRTFLAALFSGVALFTAIFPYIMVGRPGKMFGAEWMDRDTLLLPLGFSLFFVSIAMYGFSSERARKNPAFAAILGGVLPVILFASFSTMTIKGQLQLFHDAIKQDAMLKYMRTEPDFLTSFTFVFIDKCMGANIFDRQYRSYEPNGMAQSIFKEQTRYFVCYGAGDSGYPSVLSSVFPSVNGICKDWIKSSDFKYFTAEAGRVRLTYPRIVRMVIFKFFHAPRYDEELFNYFSFDLKPGARS